MRESRKNTSSANMPVMNVDENSLIDTMTKAGIPAVAIAYVANGKIAEKHLTCEDSNYPATHDTMYGAASLSKPVFAYIVLKLIQSKQFSLDTKITDLLAFDEFCNPDGKSKFTHNESVTNDLLDKITVRMLLSHSSGLNLGKTIESQFAPGTQYSYSNLGLYYLQKAIEHKTGKDLQQLAEEIVFDGLHMNNSCYYQHYAIVSMGNNDRAPRNLYIKTTDNGIYYEVIGLDGELRRGSILWENLPSNFPHNAESIISEQNKYLADILQQTSEAGHTTNKEAIAVNSLFTTPHDYALFVNAWMNDESEIMQSAFLPVISMTTDDWAKKMKIPEADLKNVAWGLGWGLQINPGNKRPHAYHTADMNMWRAEVAIDFNNKRAIVYFANSPNGHILADQIIMPNVKIHHALNYFFGKYGFARRLEPNWQLKENAGMEHIGTIVMTRNYVQTQAAKIEAKEATAHGFSSTTILQKKMPVTNKSMTANQPVQHNESSSSKLNHESKQTASQSSDDQRTDKYTSPTPYKTKYLPPGSK